MTPVISPWVFYLMSVANGIKGMCIALGIGGAITGGIYAILAFVDKSFGDHESSRKNFRIAKPLGIMAIIFIFIGVLVPSESTIGKILIAKNVTYERVEMATDAVQTVYEDIMELFEEGEE